MLRALPSPLWQRLGALLERRWGIEVWLSEAEAGALSAPAVRDGEAVAYVCGRLPTGAPPLLPADLAAVAELLAVLAEDTALRWPAGVRPGYGGMAGTSPAMQSVFVLLDKIRSSEASVLLLGENGTGKELAARAIHDGSRRSARPFLAVNCSAFPDNLVESELFGHRRGAFTGAVEDKVGLFEAADGGTLLLDEIGDTSLPMQAKLLRVLQDGHYIPLGSPRPQRADVRVIGATHRDLQALVERDRFREDLYFRLSVLVVPLPPLRERRADIPMLAEHFLDCLGRARGEKPKRLGRLALGRLVAYRWPGNVRELENEIERAVVLAGDEELIPEGLLSPRLRGEEPAERPDPPRSLDDTVTTVERNLISDVMRRNGGNRSRAARELGMSRRNLIRKIHRYRLEAVGRGA